MASPSLRVLSSRSELQLLTLDGSLARSVMESKVRVLRPMTKRHTSFAASGGVSIESISPGIIKGEPNRIIGGYTCEVVYDPPLRKGQVVTMRASLRYIDSFTGSREWYSVRVSHPTDELTIEIEFPKGVDVSSPEAKSFRGLDEQIQESPSLTNRGGRFRIAWHTNAPKNDTEYRVEWEWSRPKTVSKSMTHGSQRG